MQGATITQVTQRKRGGDRLGQLAVENGHGSFD